MRINHQICTNCVIDTTDSKITFDENGLCDHCQIYYSEIEPNWNENLIDPDKITAIADTIKNAGEGKDFDCIIGMSGGTDSSYLVYLAKKKVGPQATGVSCGCRVEFSTSCE